MKRLALPLTILIGSVHRLPASFLTVPYFALQPLQSSSLTGFGATPVTAAFAVVAAVAATEPVTLSWQMTARPIAGTSNSRHFRLPAGGDPRPAQGMRMCDPSRSRVPPVPVRPPGPPVTPV